MVIKACLMNLLAILYRHFKLKGDLEYNTKIFRKSYERLRPVIEYINENYTNDITLEALSEIAFMNKTYFSSYFKEVMQINVFTFICNIKISASCHLLKTTDKTMLAISEDCGFRNLSSFNAVFK